MPVPALDGTPVALGVPSAIPSLLASVPPASITSLIPSLSESKSKRFSMPSPSVSADNCPSSIVSKIPSLSSSKSVASATPSLSVSKASPRVVGKPSTGVKIPSPSGSQFVEQITTPVVGFNNDDGTAGTPAGGVKPSGVVPFKASYGSFLVSLSLSPRVAMFPTGLAIAPLVC